MTGAARQRVLHQATCLAVGRRLTTRSAFCRESAAILHGIRTWGVPDAVQVLARTRGSARGASDVARYVGELPEEDVELVGGLRVLTLEALALECARVLHPRDALVVVDHVLAVASAADVREPARVERECELARERLLARLAELPRGARGVRRAAGVLRWATPWSESAWESHVRWVLLSWGCRDVVSQQPVTVRGRSYRTDLAIPVGLRADGTTLWLHIEFDGRGKYGENAGRTAEALHDERRRELAISSNGDRVLRLRASEARDPEVVVARVQDALRGLGAVRLDPVRELLPPARRRARRTVA
ncbi:MAG: hypothetical protein ACTHXO_01315 [Actinomycetaceae bacterium]